MKVGIWIRVSTEMQVEDESPLHHEKRARGYAEGKAWDVVEVYRLEAVSGKSVIDHPETKRMIEDIRSGHVKALIFSKLARLARNTRELLSFSDLFQECGANLVSLGESIDTTSPAGRLYFTLIAALTQWEREEIASRVAASVPIRAKLGKPLGGAAPYGYTWQEGSLVVDEKEAPVRKLLYELFLAERRKRTVARILNEKGYRTRSGARWSDTSVSRLLKDQTAKGTRVANYTRTKDARKAWSLKDESEWVHLPCPAIISEEVWEEANRLLAANPRKPKGRPAVHLFSGRLTCSCGGKMYVPSKTSKYRCGDCGSRISSDDLEALFHSELSSFFLDEEEVEGRLLEAEVGLTDKEGLLVTLLSERKKAQKEFDDLYDLYRSGLTDKWGFGEKYKPLSARITSLDDEIPRLQGEIDAIRMSALSKEEVMSGARDLHGRWPSLERSEKRAVIETILENIIVSEEEVTITLLHTSSHYPQNATREQGFIAAMSWNRAG